jgi:LasA protease
MSQIYNPDLWQTAVTESGVFAVFQSLFGYPFVWSIDPLIPQGLLQPPLILPFENGAIWYFTGGPHGGWGAGSAWAAMDFAPSDIENGCVQSEFWVVASADGVIVRSGNTGVVLDLDGDGNEHTGWTISYNHIEARDRIAPGTSVKAGDRLGHPSCEGIGSYSDGTHVHIARRFHGEWITADGPVPFVLSGWTAHAGETEYDGYLAKGDETIQHCNCGSEDNDLWR